MAAKSAVVDLADRDVSDTRHLRNAGAVVCLSLRNNARLASAAGLELCARLWTVDLSGCALASVDALLPLGALGLLQLSNNRLDLRAALRLRNFHVGRLGLFGNPLLPALPGMAGAAAPLLLRSVLVEALPCVLALDDSFVRPPQFGAILVESCDSFLTRGRPQVAGAERVHCRQFLETPHAQACRALLLQHGVDLSALPRRLAVAKSRAPQAVQLVGLFESWDALYRAGKDARQHADIKRLRWLAADFDAHASLAHAAVGGASAAAVLGGGGGGAPLELTTIAQLQWLTGLRRQGLMGLLAFSLHHLVPGPLVLEALTRLLSPEIRADAIAQLVALPPCIRTALLVLLGRRGHDGVSSHAMWRARAVRGGAGCWADPVRPQRRPDAAAHRAGGGGGDKLKP